jgi:glycosyltransferase involved in cell wall biosynthesis
LKKRVAIVFTDWYLAYSPTTVGLYDALDAEYEVTIFVLAQEKEFERNLNRRVVRVDESRNGRATGVHGAVEKARREYARIFRPSDLINAVSASHYDDFLDFRRALSGYRPDEVIAVDFRALVIAQRTFPRKAVTFVSLEIRDDDPYRALLDPRFIARVVTQSPDRYEHLFPKKDRSVFYVPNAPIYRPLKKPTTTADDLVFCGSAAEGFGIYSCLKFLTSYPSYRLTIKGAVPEGVRQNIDIIFPELMKAGRLRIDSSFDEVEDLLRTLSHFRIGFCFYDFRYKYIDTFNYYTAPSGKLFNYFASGVPVVGINIPGLRSVRDFSAGVLIDRLDPRDIAAAIMEIETGYEGYVSNCLRAAETFSFDKAVDVLLQDIRKGS